MTALSTLYYGTLHTRRVSYLSTYQTRVPPLPAAVCQRSQRCKLLPQVATTGWRWLQMGWRPWHPAWTHTGWTVSCLPCQCCWTHWKHCFERYLKQICTIKDSLWKYVSIYNHFQDKPFFLKIDWIIKHLLLFFIPFTLFKKCYFTSNNSDTKESLNVILVNKICLSTNPSFRRKQDCQGRRPHCRCRRTVVSWGQRPPPCLVTEAAAPGGLWRSRMWNHLYSSVKNVSPVLLLQ